MSTNWKQYKTDLEMLDEVENYQHKLFPKNVLSMEYFQRCFWVNLFLNHMVAWKLL